MSEHTATPWAVIPYSYDKTDTRVTIAQSNGKSMVANLTPNAAATPESARANAAFIVRAVNAHDALVESANAMMKALRNARDMYPDQWQQIVTPAICTAWDKTKAALKLAEA